MIDIRPTGILFRPDSQRVLARPFITSNAECIRHAILRVLSLSGGQVAAELAAVRAEYRPAGTSTAPRSPTAETARWKAAVSSVTPSPFAPWSLTLVRTGYSGIASLPPAYPA